MKKFIYKIIFFVKKKELARKFIALMLIVFFLSSGAPEALISQVSKNPEVAPKKASAATYQFFPTASTIEKGTEQAVTNATIAATEGTNVGSYQGLLANDGFHWQVASIATGLDLEVTVGGVNLNGANTLTVSTEIDLDATVPNVLVQICDFVSTTSVDNVTDSYCTGGGWRTVNSRNTSNAAIAYTDTANDQLRWQIYDGYFSSTSSNGGAPISTPLANFVNGSNELKIRYYSTTNTTSVVSIDYLSIFAYIDSIYFASSYTDQTSGGGTEAGIYLNTQPLVNSATALVVVGTNDDNRQVVSGTSQVIDFYNSYTNIKQYTGMNTIMLGASVSCTSATTIRPYMYNFTSSTWTAIGSNISCITTDVAYYISHNSTSDGSFVLTDYISSGETRVRWITTASVTNGIRLDWQYLMFGSVNTDSSLCEISFGTGTATNCTNTRAVDSSGSASTFDITAEDESGTMGTGESNSFYPGDTDQDANTEEAVSANISVPVTLPANAEMVGVNWASRALGRSAGTTITVINSLKDYSGFTSTNGGWTDVGSSISTPITFQDSLSNATALTWGLHTNPDSYIDTVNGLINIRLRTGAGGATSDNNVATWDFTMLSPQWVEDSYNPTVTHGFTPTGEFLVTGTETNATSIAVAAANGVNTGSWKGTRADDNFHWELTGTSTGIDLGLVVDGVKLNGANTLMIQTEIDVDATAPAVQVQICDWISTTGVDNIADSNCTGGGWRTLNSRTTAVTPTTATAYTWYVYNGKWSNGSNTARSTPLSNFVKSDSTKRVLVRYYSTTNATTASNFAIDYLRVLPVINPVYEASGATALTNTLTNDYTNTNTVTQAGSDNLDLQCNGTTGGPDCYLSFKNIKTYSSMNTILARTEFSCSVGGTAPEIKLALYNFTTAAWVNITSEIASCSTTDTIRTGAANNITISDYVSSGEVRLRYYRSSGSDTGRVDIDTAYIMLGTTNSDSGATKCFISMGTVATNDCTATRAVAINDGSTASAWTITTEDESTNRGTGSSFDYYSFDVDMDATASEEGAASHIKFDLSGEPRYGPITAVYFAGNIMSGTAGTVQMGLVDYSAYNSGTAAVGSFQAIGGGATTALTYTDNITVGTNTTGGYAGVFTNPEDLVQTVSDEVWVRLRTSTDGASSSNSVNQWDFAMVALQWVEPDDRSMSMSISDDTIGFGNLTSANARYATGDGAGSTSETVAHTVTVASSAAAGYALTITGDTLTSDGNTITAIGASNTASSAGTEQFGIRATLSGPSPYDSVDDTYSGSGYGYDGDASTPSAFATQTQGDGFSTVYSVYYLANIAPTTESGSYSASLNYILTSTF